MKESKCISLEVAQKEMLADTVKYYRRMATEAGYNPSFRELEKIALKKCVERRYTEDDLRREIQRKRNGLPMWAKGRKLSDGRVHVRLANMQEFIMDFSRTNDSELKHASKPAEPKPAPVLPPPPKKESEEQEPETLRSPSYAPNEERSGVDLVAALCREVLGHLPMLPRCEACGSECGLGQMYCLDCTADLLYSDALGYPPTLDVLMEQAKEAYLAGKPMPDYVTFVSASAIELVVAVAMLERVISLADESQKLLEAMVDAGWDVAA